MKKTKIVCSIGPASNQADVMEQMVNAGMNVARINFSHATMEERQLAQDSVREVRKRTGKNIAILWDTKGPEFRSGVVEGESINLVEGNTIRIVKENVVGNEERITVNHPQVIDNLEVGDFILLENAKMKIEVISKENDGVTCKIINGGKLGNRKSLSVPGKKLDIPYVSDADRDDIIYSCEHGGEFLAISFVSGPEDVLEVKEILKEHGREDLQIICKIESELGIQNLEKILEVSDGAMVARGDLGTEIPSEMLPIAQKRMIKTCRKMGKICIVATEMLETMMENMRPKRAETSDIANAVFDGTDAVMLSGETTIGKHPIETVRAMANICETAEKYAKFDYEPVTNTITTAIARSVVESVDILSAKLICAATVSGSTARVISNLKPNAPILALCPDAKTGRRLALNWGVYDANVGEMNSTDEVVNDAKNKAKEFMDLTENDKIIITGGFPNTGKKTTNFMKIEEI
jgi:pyruvate kinase